MKNVVIVSFLLFSLNSFSQKIDSINVLNQNTPPEIHVFGKLYHTGCLITDVNYEVSDSIFLTLFFKECNGYQAVTPFDTVLSVTESWPVVPPNEINIISILDTNTTDSNCFIVNQYDTLEINTFSTSLSNIDNLSLIKKINIYPNPAKDILQIEATENFQIERIELFDIGGKKVKEFSKNELTLNISGFNSGIYFIKLTGMEGVLTKKIIIE